MSRYQSLVSTTKNETIITDQPRLSARARWVQLRMATVDTHSYFLIGCLVGMLAAWLLLGPILSISVKHQRELKILLEPLTAPYQARQVLPDYRWSQLRAIDQSNQFDSSKEWVNVSI